MKYLYIPKCSLTLLPYLSLNLGLDFISRKIFMALLTFVFLFSIRLWFYKSFSYMFLCNIIGCYTLYCFLVSALSNFTSSSDSDSDSYFIEVLILLFLDDY
jgi:hypothetical protein